MKYLLSSVYTGWCFHKSEAHKKIIKSQRFEAFQEIWCTKTSICVRSFPLRKVIFFSKYITNGFSHAHSCINRAKLQITCHIFWGAPLDFFCDCCIQLTKSVFILVNIILEIHVMIKFLEVQVQGECCAYSKSHLLPISCS